MTISKEPTAIPPFSRLITLYTLENWLKLKMVVIICKFQNKEQIVDCLSITAVTIH